MTNGIQSSGTPDWLVPLVLIVIALLTGLAGWGIYEATHDDAEDASLARQLEVYTACLNDNGANVPLVETRSDGGFAIIVPGSLLDHEFDTEQLRSALEVCRPLQPDPFALLSGLEGVDVSGLGFLLESELGRGDLSGQGGRFDVTPRELRQLCERLERGDIPDDARRRLRQACEMIDA